MVLIKPGTIHKYLEYLKHRLPGAGLRWGPKYKKYVLRPAKLPERLPPNRPLLVGRPLLGPMVPVTSVGEPTAAPLDTEAGRQHPESFQELTEALMNG